jgi:DNA-binding NarL/FixJ family response regulator
VKRILVIDDEPFVREALQRVLGAPSVEVVSVAERQVGHRSLAHGS